MGTLWVEFYRNKENEIVNELTGKSILKRKYVIFKLETCAQ